MQINIQISTVGYSERHAFKDPRRPTRSVYPFIFCCLFVLLSKSNHRTAAAAAAAAGAGADTSSGIH